MRARPRSSRGAEGTLGTDSLCRLCKSLTAWTGHYWTPRPRCALAVSPLSPKGARLLPGWIRPLTSSPGAKFSWHNGHRFASFSDLAAEMVVKRTQLPCACECEEGQAAGTPQHATDAAAAPVLGPGGTHGCRPWPVCVGAAPLWVWPRGSGSTSRRCLCCRTRSAGARSGWRSPPPAAQTQRWRGVSTVFSHARLAT